MEKLDEDTNKTITKNTNTNVKTAATITNWQQLKEAVQNAKDKEVTLTLGKGTYKVDSKISWDNKNTTLTIDGNGQTIDGNRKQAFSSSGTLILKNIKIRNCFPLPSFNGGAIYNNGKLTIINSTLENNQAEYVAGNGGAIYNSGTLTIIQSTFKDNLAVSGGAITNFGTLNITHSTFTKNIANKNLFEASGGAIDNRGILSITDSVLTNNTAGDHGGAIYNTGKFSINNSNFANNTASRRGGAIYNDRAEYNTIANTNFTGNHAVRAGAIFSKGYTNLTGNRFTSNTADNNETIDLFGYWNGRFKNNVYISTDILLNNSQLSLNLSDKKLVYYYGEGVELNFSIGELVNPNNYGSDFYDGVEVTIYVDDEKKVTTKCENYTLYNLNPGIHTIYYTSCNKISNSINILVMPITNWQELSKAIKSVEKNTKNVTLTLQNGTYKNTGTINWKTPNITLTIDGNGQTIDGNQLQVFNNNVRTSMVLKNITIINAKADYGGAIENRGTLTVIQSTLANNTAKENAGAIESMGTLTVIESTLANNTATGDGGAINNYGSLTISESKLDNNTATYGGAVKNYQHIFTIVDSNLTNNHAERGGAIYTYGNSNLTGNTFINNTADNNETIDLHDHTGHAENNVYKSTDIALQTKKISTKDNQRNFNPDEDIVLNLDISLKNPTKNQTI